MKLQLNKPAPKPVQTILPQPTGYESPIGWWSVTTEGDCEGRSTNKLGEYYGHVAEIAFSLADKCFYKLRFAPILDREPGYRPMYQAKKTGVWIGLDIDSKTWDMTFERRAKWMTRWLDAEEIKCLPTDGVAHYYASTYLKLKE